MVSERKIPLLELQAQYRRIRTEVLAEVTRVIDSQEFILGEEVRAFEHDIAAYCNCKYAVGCASGSDALVLALLALGIQPDEEVLTTPHSFFATAGSIVRAGARPVFVDVDPQTFNLDVNQVADTLNRHSKVRVLLPVHLFGASADMDPLLDLATQRGLFVVEDAAQAIGAEHKGRRVGSIGHIGCFSFFPSKNLGGYGDGGMLTTNDLVFAERLRALRVHGARRNYVHDWVGINSRLDALQAAVLRVKFRYLDSWTRRRQENAAHYRRRFADLKIPVKTFDPAAYMTRHVYHQFVVCGTRRDELRGYLKQHGVGTQVYYPIPLHLQPCFAYLGYKLNDFRISERLAQTSLALPVHPDLSADDIDYVCEIMRIFYS